MSRRRGYSLVEVILVIVVSGIVLPPILFAFAQVGRTSARPDLLVTASALARERLETLQADKYNPVRGYDYLIAANYPAENPVAGTAAFTRSVAFTDVSAADLSTTQSGSGFRRAVVTVAWSGGAARYTLTALFTDH